MYSRQFEAGYQMMYCKVEVSKSVLCDGLGYNYLMVGPDGKKVYEHLKKNIPNRHLRLPEAHSFGVYYASIFFKCEALQQAYCNCFRMCMMFFRHYFTVLEICHAEGMTGDISNCILYLSMFSYNKCTSIAIYTTKKS